MTDLTLELVSLTSASFESITGLDWQTVAEHDPAAALVQESGEQCYEEFLRATAGDRPAQSTIEQAISNRLTEAARIYRNLSGHWAGHGEFDDAGRAYVRSRRLEREAMGPSSNGGPFRPLQWLWLWLADLVCGFGENLGRVVIWLSFLALLPALIYWVAGGVSGANGPLDNLLFSVSQLTSSPPSDLSPANRVVTWIGVLQTLFGVGLVGLFGFVLANKIRSS